MYTTHNLLGSLYKGFFKFFGMRITQKLNMAYILGHVYFLNFIAVYKMCTIDNTRSVVKEADPQNGGFRMLLQCYAKSLKCPKQINYQQQPLSVACV